MHSVSSSLFLDSLANNALKSQMFRIRNIVSSPDAELDRDWALEVK